MITDKILKEQIQNLVQQTIQAEDLSEKSKDLSHDNNAIKIKKTKTNKQTNKQKKTTTRIKSKSFFSNIFYARLNDNDIVDKNFCFDTYVLVTKNTNPFSLERKISDALVTKIYVHYTFEQSDFKRNFVIMNQVFRQQAKTKVEKDFYKLMNSSSFEIDCRNNIDKCNFKAIYDEIEEISYLQRYASLYF